MIGRDANYAFSVTGGLVRVDLGPHQSSDQLAIILALLPGERHQPAIDRCAWDPSTIPDADRFYEAVLAIFDAGVPKNFRVTIVVRTPNGC